MKKTTLAIRCLVLSLAPLRRSRPQLGSQRHPPPRRRCPRRSPCRSRTRTSRASRRRTPKPAPTAIPDGGLTGNVSDITCRRSITDKTPKAKGLTIGDIVNQIGQNKIAINFVWTLVTGFLVMFMQAGFALVETGLCRAKNANHTMMMNFMVYGVGMLAYWLIGFAIQMGGVGANRQPGRHAAAEQGVRHQSVRQAFGLFGHRRHSSYARRHL